MRFKFTMLFQLATNISDPTATARRLGGWSESWYFEGPSAQSLYAAAFGTALGGGATQLGLCGVRSLLLPFGGAIVGQRIQQLEPLGPSQSLSANFPGSAAAADVPQMALLCTIPGLTVSNTRRAILRGMPDIRVVEGEYSPSQAYAAFLAAFFEQLGNWRFRGLDLSQPSIPIINISAAGVVQLGGLSAGFAVNDKVKILRAVDGVNEPVGGIFMVGAIPSATQITLIAWTAGACTGGSCRKHAVIYPLVDSANCKVGRIITRRVGRPFTQYRGRRSRRRR